MNIFESNRVNADVLPGTRRLKVLREQPKPAADPRYAVGMAGWVYDFNARIGAFQDYTQERQVEQTDEWRTGAPPCVGWWNATANSQCYRDSMRSRRFRHWNGEAWSSYVDVEAEPSKDFIESAEARVHDRGSDISFRLERAPWDADADGWLAYSGTECPVPPHTMIMVWDKHGNMSLKFYRADRFTAWPNFVAYKVQS